MRSETRSESVHSLLATSHETTPAPSDGHDGMRSYDRVPTPLRFHAQSFDALHAGKWILPNVGWSCPCTWSSVLDPPLTISRSSNISFFSRTFSFTQTATFHLNHRLNFRQGDHQLGRSLAASILRLLWAQCDSYRASYRDCTELQRTSEKRTKALQRSRQLLLRDLPRRIQQTHLMLAVRLSIHSSFRDVQR